METKKLVKLLELVVEVNRLTNYKAAFRYGIDYDGLENLAIDVYSDGNNLYHSHVNTNSELDDVLPALESVLISDTQYQVIYSDKRLKIDEVLPSLMLAQATALEFKNEYGKEPKIVEVLK